MKKAEVITTEEIIAEAKQEVKEAPSTLRKKLRQFEAKWERTSILTGVGAIRGCGP